MTATFTAHALQEVLGARLVSGDLAISGSGSISTDTRTITDHHWYLPLKGERFDGHQFVASALEKGAMGCVIAESQVAALDLSKAGKAIILAVSDTLDAYHQAATFWRKSVNPLVVAVTGSSGKTTTKEMCSAVFSASRRVHRSRANENNEFGVPKTILEMSHDTQILVVEMAMRGLGQIDQLARCALPDIGIITCAGTAHMELLGSLENIAKAKCELFAHLKNGVGIVGDPSKILMEQVKLVEPGKLLLHKDDSLKEVEVTMERTKFRVAGLDNLFSMRAHGTKHMEDAWCAVTAAQEAGLTGDEIERGVASYEPVDGRGNRLFTTSGAIVVDESYNANPDSVRCAVEAIMDSRAFPQAQKLVVLGEMAELGESSNDMHLSIGRWLKEQKLDLLITVGERASSIAQGAEGASFAVQTCDDQQQAIALLESRLNKDTCVMVKGSHCANLGDLVNRLVKS